MRALVLVLVLTAFVAAPALVVVPTAHACQPYPYYCAFNGNTYWVCGGAAAGVHVTIACVRDSG